MIVGMMVMLVMLVALMSIMRVAVRGGFVHQAFALKDTEAVLFIDGHKTEARKSHVFLDERVCANHELRFARTNTLKSSLLFR